MDKNRTGLRLSRSALNDKKDTAGPVPRSQNLLGGKKTKNIWQRNSAAASQGEILRIRSLSGRFRIIMLASGTQINKNGTNEFSYLESVEEPNAL